MQQQKASSTITHPKRPKRYTEQTITLLQDSELWSKEVLESGQRGVRPRGKEVGESEAEVSGV